MLDEAIEKDPALELKLNRLPLSNEIFSNTQLVITIFPLVSTTNPQYSELNSTSPLGVISTPDIVKSPDVT
jgi:hypothetical protein